ncbi:hypothetical protein FACS1894187_05210 [Synergistales bacterium]|nr:hypothetical protein FACS1894187_05210 [Synergistales bacterium]
MSHKKVFGFEVVTYENDDKIFIIDPYDVGDGESSVVISHLEVDILIKLLQEAKAEIQSRQ